MPLNLNALKAKLERQPGAAGHPSTVRVILAQFQMWLTVPSSPEPSTDVDALFAQFLQWQHDQSAAARQGDRKEQPQ